MKKKIYIPILVVVLLLSTCYGEALLYFNRVEVALFGECPDYRVVNRDMNDNLFLFSEVHYYFHVEVTPQSGCNRPNFLNIDNYPEEVQYYIGVFRREQTFSDSSLDLDGDLQLYRGGIKVPDTACASHFCAVYWLEDRQHNEMFVSVNSF